MSACDGWPDSRAASPRLDIQIVKLKAFSKFENTTEALAAATSLVDSKLGKGEQPAVGWREKSDGGERSAHLHAQTP